MRVTQPELGSRTPQPMWETLPRPRCNPRAEVVLVSVLHLLCPLVASMKGDAVDGAPDWFPPLSSRRAAYNAGASGLLLQKLAPQRGLPRNSSRLLETGWSREEEESRFEKRRGKSNKLKNHSSAGNGIYYSEIKMSQGVHVSPRPWKRFFPS